MKFNKKGGVVGDLISGTGGLIILVVIVMIIVSTLLGANLLGDDATTAYAVINESTGGLNATGYELSRVNVSTSGYAITAVWANVSLTPYLIPSTNYTVSTSGILTNNSIIPNATEYNDANVSYTFIYSFDNTYKVTSDNMAGNFTEGIDNVSTKIPTILLIAAVVLLFGVIVLLVRQAGAMGIGAGGASL